MARDEFERASGQFAAGRNFVPRRCTGRMRQRNYVKVMSGARNLEFSANYFLQFVGQADSFPYNFCAVEELHDSQAAHRNDETRPQN